MTTTAQNNNNLIKITGAVINITYYILFKVLFSIIFEEIIILKTNNYG